MHNTEYDLHEAFHREAAKLLSALPEEAAVFETLWGSSEYRWAWKYLQEQVIDGEGVVPHPGFAEVNERFFSAFIA